MKETNITTDVKSWWAGSAEVEQFMPPVAEAISRHLKRGPAWTDIYNRAYEAVYKAIHGAAPIANHPVWEDRALKAEAELRRFYKNLGQLTVEHIDLKSMLADAGVRVEVLQKRLDKLVAILNERRIGCPPGREESSKWCDLFLCDECWKDWLEQEVQP